jgi:phage host-nuclease inhibitor protein Gam
MWSKKRFIIIPIILTVMLFGGTAGIALADEGDEDTPRVTFVEMVADILGITPEQLQSAFCDARTQMQELDPEERNAEQFKNILSEILYTEYGIEYGALDDALVQAKEAMHEQLEAYNAQIQEQLEARRAELQQRLEARREQLRERLEAHSSEQQEWLEARREQLKERLEARIAEFQEWFEAQKGELRGRIEAWRDRLQEWREAQKEELQGRIEAWRNRVQEWRETQGN